MFDYNPLARKWGRLLTFFFLYITEGIPLGFTATVMSVQMRQAGVPPDQIGYFVGSLYVPWAWKWIAGPFVDLLYSNRLGRRRGWIVGMQLLLTVTLLFCIPMELPGDLRLLVGIIFVHNCFAATMDVAIDALACSVLRPEEKGLGNGLMFGGQYLGQTVGGSCVLFLVSGIDWIPFLENGISYQAAYWFVAGSLLLITTLVALPIREEPVERPQTGEPLTDAARQVADYAKTALRAFFSSRVSIVALIVALLPFGAHALGLATKTTLQVELGLKEGDIAKLELQSTILSGLFCIIGGLLSDRIGRLKSIAVYLVLMAIPTLWLAASMREFGWIMPVEVTDPNRPPVPAELVDRFWNCVLLFSIFQGLYYGAQTALFMELVDPKVAATQFTAYMALMNLVTAYSAAWQGAATMSWGYPVMLVVDAFTGLICIALFPLLRKDAPSVDSPVEPHVDLHPVRD